MDATVMALMVPLALMGAGGDGDDREAGGQHRDQPEDKTLESHGPDASFR